MATEWMAAKNYVSLLKVPIEKLNIKYCDKLVTLIVGVVNFKGFKSVCKLDK